MTKANITQYSSTASSNTDIDDINIDENCPASGLNNALRSLMAHLKNVDTGSQALTALSVTGALSAKGGAVFNEDSADVDFRVESNGDANMLFVDGGNDRIGIGTSSPNANTKLDVNGSVRIGNNSDGIMVENNTGSFDIGNASYIRRDSSSGALELTSGSTTARDMLFRTGSSGAESMRISSSGSVGISESAPQSKLHITTADSSATAQSGSALILEGTDATRADLQFLGDSGAFQAIYFGDNSDADIGRIAYSHSGNSMRFTVNASERLRIHSSGRISVNSSATPSSQLQVHADLQAIGGLVVQNTNGATGGAFIAFLVPAGGAIGSISNNNTSVSYNTSSDYRLKENVVTDWDATTRLKQLKPSRFNFIADADTTVDGFLAHEVQAIVPEAISGTKDAVDADGNAVMQGIDQSKIVPLLTKTILELEARITALEGA